MKTSFTSKRLRAAFREFGADRSGSPAVEFALVLPFAVILLTGLLEFGMALYQSDSLEAGARAGAQYALAKGLDSAGIESAVEAASNLDPGSLYVVSDEFCECAGTYYATCPTACSPATTTLERYISVTVDQTYTPLLGLVDFAVPDTLHGEATVRVP
jgi:Flp pilus assembly protein TadG